MSSRVALATLLLAAAVAPAYAEAPACRGSLAGSVKGEFECDVAVRPTADGGQAVFVVDGKGPIPGVPSYAPGAFEIPEPIETKTYTLDMLGMGRASVAAEGGTLYTATKTSTQRGEVTLKLTSARKDRGPKGSYAVHGTYKARLLPAGAGKQGEVIVEVEF